LNRLQDSQLILKEDPDLHFDAEHVPGGQKRLFERNNQINVVVTIDQNFPAARNLLGQSLHSIQVDFRAILGLDFFMS
jgi:hypothetical protein